LNRHRPLDHDIHSGQVQYLHERIVGDEGALRLSNLPKLPVEIFNGVGRINQFSDFGRVFKHRGELVPVDPPGFYGQRVFPASFGFKFIHGGKSGLLGRRFVNGL